MRIGLTALALVLAANVGLAKDPADWRPTERWRGFNLLGMFREPGDTSDHRAIGYFTEDEFQWIHDWGFNFVRLPMDYRHWIVDGDWNTFDEKVFERLDKVVEWGTKYGIHVQFCFHRAPGYSILSWEKQDKLQLKSSDVPLKAFAKQWAAFARHYRDVPNERLSFNLFNEPSGFTPERYDHVARTLISAIRREDPKRFIISDGIRMASTPIPSLYSVPGVGQAMRGYAPTVISHHRVFYSQGSSFRPVWPITRESPKCFCLVGPKEKGHAAFEIVGASAGEWKFHPGRTFGRVTLRVTADGETLGEKTYEPKMDDEEHWMSPKKVGGTVEASAFDAFAVTLRRPAKRLAISAVDGGRIRIGSLEVTAPDGRHAELATDTTSGEPLKPDGNANFVQRFDGWTAEPQFRAADSFGPLAHRRATFGMDYLEDISFGRWSAAAEESGIYLMVGEFGCRATAPHDTMLRMTEDQLRLWKELGWGWALWNLRGYCGVLDTGRTDVPMEDFHGHKLDRKLLELLRKW